MLGCTYFPGLDTCCMLNFFVIVIICCLCLFSIFPGYAFRYLLADACSLFWLRVLLYTLICSDRSRLNLYPFTSHVLLSRIGYLVRILCSLMVHIRTHILHHPEAPMGGWSFPFFSFEFFNILHIFVPCFSSHRIVLIQPDFNIHCVMLSHSCILPRDIFFFIFQDFTYIHRNTNVLSFSVSKSVMLIPK